MLHVELRVNSCNDIVNLVSSNDIHNQRGVKAQVD